MNELKDIKNLLAESHAAITLVVANPYLQVLAMNFIKQKLTSMGYTCQTCIVDPDNVTALQAELVTGDLFSSNSAYFIPLPKKKQSIDVINQLSVHSSATKRLVFCIDGMPAKSKVSRAIVCEVPKPNRQMMWLTAYAALVKIGLNDQALREIHAATRDDFSE